MIITSDIRLAEVKARVLEKFIDCKTNTLGAETFANFANFTQIRESLRRENSILTDSRKFMHAKFFKFFFFFSKLVGCP